MHDRVRSARVARLATVDPQGRPAVVPCTFVLTDHALAGSTFYTAVDHKPKRTRDLARLRNIAARPDVAVLVDHYADDWDTLWWVRLRGRGRILEQGDERERAVDLLVRKYPQYRDQRPAGPVVAVDVDDWRGWRPT